MTMLQPLDPRQWQTGPDHKHQSAHAQSHLPLSRSVSSEPANIQYIDIQALTSIYSRAVETDIKRLVIENILSNN